MGNASFQTNSKPWGSHSLLFDIPCVTEIKGLSALQKETLEQAFEGFLIQPEHCLVEGKHQKDVRHNRHVCTAYRLDQPVKQEKNEFNVNDFYSPSIEEVSNKVQLRGCNFEASFGSPQSSDADTGRLGVWEESDLPLLNVIENYLRIYTAYWAACNRGGILHSAGLIWESKAYVFVAYSGVGKTTLSAKLHAAGGGVLSDDINLILPHSDAGYHAHKVPFTGEFGRTIEHNRSVRSYPVRAILLMEQGDELSVETCSKSVSVARLVSGSPFVNSDIANFQRLVQIYDDMLDSVPVRRICLSKCDQVSDIISSVEQSLVN